MKKEYALFADNQLIASYREGDTDAFGELFSRHKDIVYRFINNIVRNDTVAEDLLQETFVRAMEKITWFRGESRFNTWICTIGRNLAISYMRRERKVEPVSGGIIDCSTSVHDVIELREQYADLFQKINLLPPSKRHVIVLRHFAGLSFSKISSLVSTKTTSGTRANYITGIQKLKFLVQADNQQQLI